jgi:hypothetical protein
MLCALVEVWRRRGSRARWALALGLLLIATAPPYAIAWAKTGNPLFPFRNEKFHSPQLNPKRKFATTVSANRSPGTRRTTSRFAATHCTKDRMGRSVFST